MFDSKLTKTQGPVISCQFVVSGRRKEKRMTLLLYYLPGFGVVSCTRGYPKCLTGSGTPTLHLDINSSQCNQGWVTGGLTGSLSAICFKSQTD